MSEGLFREPEDTALAGTVSREVYRNEAGTFAVVRVETKEGYLSTVTGALPPVEPGERLELKGEWVEDARHGRQFRAREAFVKPPDSREAIERYLGTGSIDGVGPELAKRIVEAFGEATLHVLDHEQERLREVKGIGKKKAETILKSWTGQRASRDALLFLRGHGLGPVLAQRVLLRYGAGARQALEQDPYQLAREVDGVGFLTADRLARSLGFALDDARRLRAGLLHVAGESLAQGSTAVLVEELLEQAARTLGSSAELLEVALDEARDDLALELDRPEGEDVVYLPRVLRRERGAARGTLELVSGMAPRRVPPIDVPRALEWLAEHDELALTEAQAEAVGAALTSPLTVITGGPGVGKTTIVRAIVRILRAKKVAFAQGAPTGRAAKRLEQATGAEASTLHRLLEWDPRGGGFAKGRDDPLECDAMIVDEASMLDLALYGAILRALPPGASLILIGDVDQLPSVGAGNVLGDLIASGAARVVRLIEVFRQAAASNIVTAAHAVNSGEIPELKQPEGSDFFFIERDDPEAARRTIATLVKERIPKAFGLDPLRDIQVLAPMHRGACGTEELNRALKEALVPGGDSAPGRLDPGDRVMQLKNDYEHEVFNGDVGRVVEVDPGSGAVLVDFEGKSVLVSRGERSRLALAYCATVHKSQGSEYAAVVLPLLTEHFVMLQRNLLYTGLTRARQLAVIVGQRRAVELAVGNDRPSRRRSYLGVRIQGGLNPPGDPT